MLTPAERAEIDALRTWLRSVAPPIVRGYWVEGDPDFTDYCEAHAVKAAGPHGHATAVECGDDYPRVCEVCDAPLDTGGLVTPGRYLREIDDSARPLGLSWAPDLLTAAETLEDAADWLFWLTLAREVKANA